MSTDNTEKDKNVPFIFDFQKAVEEARRDYPRQTAKITFIDGSDPKALGDINAWADQQNISATLREEIMGQVEDEGAFSISTNNGYQLLVIFTARESERRVFPNDPHKSNQLAFDHELGHLVMPEGVLPKLSQQEFLFNSIMQRRGLLSDVEIYAHRAEHEADAFATLRGLKRGTLTKQDIAHMATLHDGGFVVLGALDHLTSVTFDSIAINPKNTHFLSLSPKEIIKIAHRHSVAAMHPDDAERKFFDIRNIGRGEDMTFEEKAERRLHALTDMCMTSGSKSPEFYLAGRILLDVIDNGGVSYLHHRFTLDTSVPHWQDVRANIIQKAGDRDLGARKAHQKEDLTEESTGLIGRIKSRFAKLHI